MSFIAFKLSDESIKSVQLPVKTTFLTKTTKFPYCGQTCAALPDLDCMFSQNSIYSKAKYAALFGPNVR